MKSQVNNSHKVRIIVIAFIFALTVIAVVAGVFVKDQLSKSSARNVKVVDATERVQQPLVAKQELATPAAAALIPKPKEDSKAITSPSLQRSSVQSPRSGSPPKQSSAAKDAACSAVYWALYQREVSPRWQELVGERYRALQELDRHYFGSGPYLNPPNESMLPDEIKEEYVVAKQIIESYYKAQNDALFSEFQTKSRQLPECQ